jgi:hypothetical protein
MFKKFRDRRRRKKRVVGYFPFCVVLMNVAVFAFSADFVHASGCGAESFGFTFGGA